MPPLLFDPKHSSENSGNTVLPSVSVSVTCSQWFGLYADHVNTAVCGVGGAQAPQQDIHSIITRVMNCPEPAGLAGSGDAGLRQPFKDPMVWQQDSNEAIITQFAI